MKLFVRFTITLVAVTVLAATAGAVPRLQTYIAGANYYHNYFERDFATWITQSSTFDLKVVGYWHPSVNEGMYSLSLRDEALAYDKMRTWLMISTPANQSGRVYINGAEITSFNSYDNALGAMPSNFAANPSLPNHEPAGGALYNFHYVGEIDNTAVRAQNYAYGMIGTPGWGDEILLRNVSVSGFSWVHFDAVGIDQAGQTWVNPYSRDSSYFSAVPEPGTLSLLGLGLLGLVPILRKRR